MKYPLIIMLLLVIASVSALNITEPQAQTYNDTQIDVSVEHNETLESISYSLDGDNATEACTNCSTYDTELNLTEGEHELAFTGTLGNDTYEDEVTFTINLTIPEINETPEVNDTINETDNETFMTDFTIELTPTGTVNEADVEVTAEANETLDNLTLTLDNHETSCNDCDELALELVLSEGDYTILATGTLGNLTKNYNATFTVAFEEEEQNETEEEDEDNETEPRFSTDYNQLPKEVTAGLYTDAELADIIRNNDLNPGVVNRLIKTGMLGNESIDALLDYDFQPKGVFGKLFYRMGFKGKTYANQIAKHYEVNESLQEELVNHPDVNKGQAKKQERAAAPDEKKQSPGQIKKGLEPGEHGDDEPLNKQDGNGQGKGNGNGKNKIPPGQAKKNS